MKEKKGCQKLIWSHTPPFKPFFCPGALKDKNELFTGTQFIFCWHCRSRLQADSVGAQQRPNFPLHSTQAIDYFPRLCLPFCSHCSETNMTTYPLIHSQNEGCRNVLAATTRMHCINYFYLTCLPSWRGTIDVKVGEMLAQFSYFFFLQLNKRNLREQIVFITVNICLKSWFWQRLMNITWDQMWHIRHNVTGLPKPGSFTAPAWKLPDSKCSINRFCFNLQYSCWVLVWGLHGDQLDMNVKRSFELFFFWDGTRLNHSKRND